MNNYAGRSDMDFEIADELRGAGINVLKLSEDKRNEGEVQTIIRGELHGWKFFRAWYYWIASGPEIPLKEATELHEKFGQEVRVAGHCGCPSPLEWYKGKGVPLYHVDSHGGLKALADTISKVYGVENDYKLS